jgi:HPt (histidine-containing phosphotransfer) domain-containing protein
MLIELFIKKMGKQLPELESAIEEKNYKKIASIAHSIKGSSANFRIEALQKSASEMEKMARNEDKVCDFLAIYKEIKQKVETIQIVK